MNIVLINGSPRKGRSNSNECLKIIEQYFPQENKQNTTFSYIDISLDFFIDIEKLKSIDAIILSAPLYVDSLPSTVISVLEEVRQHKNDIFKNISFYGLMNNGFIEGHQNKWGLKQIELFCDEVGFIWKGGLGMGGGEMMKSMVQYPDNMSIKAPVVNAYKEFAKTICNKAKLKDDIYVQYRYPRFLFIRAGQKGWNYLCKQNNLTVKDLDARPLEDL